MVGRGRSIRILIHGMNYAPEMLGVGRYTGDLGRHLAARGNDVDVVTAPPHYPGWRIWPGFRIGWYQHEILNGTRVIRCPLLVRSRMAGIWRLLAPLSFALSAGPVVLWHALRKRPDVILCVEPSLFCAPAALLASRLTGAKAVLHIQDLEIDAAFAVGHLRHRWLQRLASRFERACLKRFDTVVTISDRMKEKILEKGVEQSRLRIIRNWVDLAQIRFLDGPNSYRQTLAIPAERFVVLYSGNVGLKQALHVLLDAARYLVDEPSIVFVISGDGPEKDELMRRYSALGNVVFLPTQPEQKLCELLNLADLHVIPQDAKAADLVLPSKLGGILASGRQVLITANPGTELHTFLRDTAMIVPAGDSQQLAGVIRTASRERKPVPAEEFQRLLAQLDSRSNLSAFEAVLGST